MTGRVDMAKLPDCGAALVPPFTPIVGEVCNDSILAIQHTRFACGSVSLGFRLHHIACDAEGLFQLVRDLAEIYRGVRIAELNGGVNFEAGILAVELSHPPHIHSYLAELSDMSPEAREEALKFRPSLFTLGPSHGGKTAGNEAVTEYTTASSQPKFTGRTMRFSPEELKALKDLAADLAGLGRISTFDALSAHIYQHIYQARMRLQDHLANSCSQELDYSELPRGFLTSVNVRRPDRLNLPAHYFPNAVVTIFKTLSHDDLAIAPLSRIAKVLA